MISALADFAEHEWRDGIQIDELEGLESLCVHTRNTTYEIVVTAPDSEDVLIRGGARFPAFTRVRLCGSTCGGHVVKSRGIHPGFRLELVRDGRRILTSTILSVSILPPTAKH